MNPETNQPKITKIEMFNSIVATLANSIVEETMKDADIEAQMSEVIRIQRDAEREQPESDIGKQVRSDAFKMIEKYESSEDSKPERQNQWANDQRNETTNVAVIAILRLIADKADTLVYQEGMTREQNEEQMTRFDKIAKGTLDIMTKHKVPLKDDSFIFDQLAYVIGMLKRPVLDAISERKTEILARIVGARNPKTEKFDADQMTYGDLIKSLDKVRAETGEDEYFINNK